MDETGDTRDNLTRLLNLGRRKRPRISRRYSMVVKALRFALPFAALVIVAVLLALNGSEEAFKAVPKEKIVPLTTGRNELINPHYESASKDQRPYTVTADKAVQSLNDTQLVLLDKPKSDMTLKGGDHVQAESDKGVYRQDTQMLALDGNVKLHHQLGYTLHTTHMDGSMQDEIFWTEQPVHGDGPKGTIEGTAALINNDTGLLLVLGPHAKLVLTQTKAATP